MNESKILDMLRETEHDGRFGRPSAYGEQVMHQVAVMSKQKVLYHAKDPYEALSDVVNSAFKNPCEDFRIRSIRVPGDSL